MDGFSQVQFEDMGLEKLFQEILDFQVQDVIQFHVGLIQCLISDDMMQQSIALKNASLILLIQGEQLLGSFVDLDQGELHALHFMLVPQSMITSKFQLLVKL